MKNFKYHIVSLAIFFTTFNAFCSLSKTTIWMIGDSTMCNYPETKYPQTGWGQVFSELCTEDVEIKNLAAGGLSTKSFLASGKWQIVMENIKKDDYVIIQFGHNDQKPENELNYAPVDGLYKELLTKYITETREKGGEPVLATSVCRRLIKNGKIYNSIGDYPTAMKKVAIETDTPIVDLNQMTLDEFNKIGYEQLKFVFLFADAGQYPAFPNGVSDNSHFQVEGAKLIAKLFVTEAIRQDLYISACFTQD